jgi:hypothetical protein
MQMGRLCRHLAKLRHAPQCRASHSRGRSGLSASERRMRSRLERADRGDEPARPGPIDPGIVLQQKATIAPDIRLIRHIDLHMLFSRAREECFPRSVALAESARRGVPRQAGSDILGEQGKASRRGPRCRSTGLSPAQRWLPPHRSRRATLEDGARCICSRPAAGPGTSVPMGARFHFFEVPAVSRLRAALSWAGRPIFVRRA